MAVPTDHAYADIDNEVQESNTANTTKRRRTGYACAVADCCARHSDGVSLHKFPKVQEVRRQWIKFVSTCRADFGSSFGTRTENSRICERHFAPDCYPASYALSESLGLMGKPKRKDLLPTAIPTIQRPAALSVSAFGVASCIVTTTVSVADAGRRESSLLTRTSTSRSQPVCTPIVAEPLPGVTKLRGAYAKREHQRVSYVTNIAYLYFSCSSFCLLTLSV